MFKNELASQQKEAKRYMDTTGDVIYHDFYIALRKNTEPEVSMVLKGISFSDIVRSI